VQVLQDLFYVLFYLWSLLNRQQSRSQVAWGWVQRETLMLTQEDLQEWHCNSWRMNEQWFILVEVTGALDSTKVYSMTQKNPPEVLRQFFQNGWEFFDQILHVYYEFLCTLDHEFFIQLSATLTKLCHIKCDHPAFVSADGGHFEHTMAVALNAAYLRQSCSNCLIE